MSTKIIINSELPNLLCHVLFRLEFVRSASTSSVVIVLIVLSTAMIDLNFLLPNTLVLLLLYCLTLQVPKGAYLLSHVEITYKWVFPSASYILRDVVFYAISLLQLKAKFQPFKFFIQLQISYKQTLLHSCVGISSVFTTFVTYYIERSYSRCIKTILINIFH